MQTQTAKAAVQYKTALEPYAVWNKYTVSVVSAPAIVSAAEKLPEQDLLFNKFTIP